MPDLVSKPTISVSPSVINDAGRMKLVEGYCEQADGRGAGCDYFKLALERFTHAAQADPANPDYLLNMAEALFALGKNNEAIQRLEEVKRLPAVNEEQLAGLTRRYSSAISMAKSAKSQLTAATLPPALEDSVKEEDPSTWPDWNSHPQMFRTG